MRAHLAATLVLSLWGLPLAAAAQADPAPPARAAKKKRTGPAKRTDGKAPAEPERAATGSAADPAAESALASPSAAPGAPAPASPPAAQDAVPSAPPSAAPAGVAPAGGAKEEVVTDFDEEEKQLDKRIEKEVGKPPAAGAPGGKPFDLFSAVGMKLVADLVLQYQVGTKSVSFFPNHTLVILMLNVTERFSAQIHIAPDPAFYELSFAVTPTFTIKAGKLLVPFGTNNFHHIIGGRVDQQSQFLPETWGDYGLGVTHLLLDFKYLSLEYDAYVVNGFGGSTAPVIASGALVDNNFGKGLGGRVTLGLPLGIRLVGSVYWSLWSPENDKGVLYYSAGAVLPVGAIRLPVLDRIGLRGEWSRGELQALDENVQQGITAHAVAKAGWYAELTVRLVDLLSLRMRVGRLNPDNTITNADDVEVYEPAVVFGTPKLSLLAAWQFTRNSGKPYSMTAPSDVLYAKLFVQY